MANYFAVQLSPRKRLFYALLALAGINLIVSMAMTMRLGSPYPVVHDEFSYLLMGETFAGGELARPPHPMRAFFETFHILQEPHYASKYFPLQGVILALGFLLGAPIIGVWWGTVMMSWAFYYVARAVAQPRIAFPVALWATLQFGALSYWGHTFWGGAGFAIAGALILGGVLRTRRRESWPDQLGIGAGLMLVLLSRPLEGFVFGLPVGAFYLQAWWRRRQVPRRQRLSGLLLPTLGVALGLGGLGLYNRAVTGSAFLLPQQLYQKTYFSDVSFFTWKAEPVGQTAQGDPNLVEAATLDEELPIELKQFSEGSDKPILSGPIEIFSRLYLVGNLTWRFYLGIAGTVALGTLLVSGRLFRGAVEKLILALILVRLALPLVVRSSTHPHYIAAWAAASVVLICLAVRFFEILARRDGNPRRYRLWPAYLLAPVTLFGVLMILSEFRFNNFPVGSWTPGLWKGFAEQRESVEVHVLSASPGRGHLLLVNYLPGHSIHQEWVFNGPRIDEQPVVWARDLEEIAPILDYYPDRHVWRVTVGSPFEPIDLKRLRRPLDLEAESKAPVEE